MSPSATPATQTAAATTGPKHATRANPVPEVPRLPRKVKVCVCVSKLCVYELCMSKLYVCVYELRVSKLSVSKLCASKLCVSKFCVCV